jgi:hypothetical protein
MPHHNEDQWTGSPFLPPHIQNARGTRDGLTHAQHAPKLDPVAGPHTARQGDRRQESAAMRVTVFGEIGLPVARQEVKPMPERRHRIAGPRLGIVTIERRRQRRHRRRRDQFGPCFRLANPLLQMSNVHRSWPV